MCPSPSYLHHFKQPEIFREAKLIPNKYTNELINGPVCERDDMRDAGNMNMQCLWIVFLHPDSHIDTDSMQHIIL